MDFTTTEAQRDLAGLTRDIVAKYSTNEAQRQLDSNPTNFDRPLWDALEASGVMSATLPEALGGDGFGVLEWVSIVIELGRGLAAVPFVSSTTAAMVTAAMVTEDDGSRILALALDDEDQLDPPVEATRAGDDWVLTGTKSGVDHAPIADGFLVATTDGVFLLDAGQVTVVPQSAVDNRSIGIVRLDSVTVDSSRRRDASAQSITARATLGTCAYQLGVLEESLRVTADYARERVQFGKPIGSFQAVAQRLADAYIDVKGARLTLWRAAWALSADRNADEEIAVAKFWAADAGHRVAHTLVHVHGGVGLDRDHPVHRYFLAAKRSEFAYGGATAQLRRLGASLAAVPA
ncbi:acyl-CoA dehydrogenase family protein [Rhodococcus sp. G-MC3]|uniref:acyl-CoA dehydrogenase family protein n=1 Tax=Rhodococcus sp. G-MC3 TaxID=3046209 RepID=UPI0024BBB3AA|nr:acyl-CoA dehydrogenase family protein [Rhodococcus sp. G-MC3]MDJ0395314.1 acyl-CoA dehydrogenase family protein [Rhodococcus sp. G-MC3]